MLSPPPSLLSCHVCERHWGISGAGSPRPGSAGMGGALWYSQLCHIGGQPGHSAEVLCSAVHGPSPASALLREHLQHCGTRGDVLRGQWGPMWWGGDGKAVLKVAYSTCPPRPLSRCSQPACRPAPPASPWCPLWAGVLSGTAASHSAQQLCMVGAEPHSPGQGVGKEEGNRLAPAPWLCEAEQAPSGHVMCIQMQPQ